MSNKPQDLSILKSASGGVSPIWLLCLGVAVIGSNSLLLSPILGDVSAALAAPPATIARAIGSYGGATACSALLLAPRIDAIGPARALYVAMSILSLSLFGSSLAGDWLALTSAQAVAGAAAGIALPATYALATSLPGRTAAETLGRVLTGWSISLVAGIPTAALIAERAGWRWAYAAVAALAGVVAFGAWFTSSGGAPISEPTARPSWRKLLMRSPIRILLMACLAYMTAFYSVYAFLGEQLRQTLGATASSAALVASAYGVGFGAASFLDRAIDRIGARRLFPIVLMALALLYFAIPLVTRAFWPTTAFALLWGVINHFGLNILVLLLTQFERDARGAVLGLNSAVTYLGALIGAAMGGALFTHINFDAIAYVAGAYLLCAALIVFLRLPLTRA